MIASHRYERGFTLLEALVVLAIIALASAVALPRLAGRVETRTFESQIREIAAGLRFARLEALKSGEETHADIDVERKLIVVAGRTIAMPPAAHLEVLTTRGLIVAGKTASIRFVPQGGSTGGAISLTMEEQIAKIEISWLTGGVSLTFEDPR